VIGLTAATTAPNRNKFSRGKGGKENRRLEEQERIIEDEYGSSLHIFRKSFEIESDTSLRIRELLGRVSEKERGKREEDDAGASKAIGEHPNLTDGERGRYNRL